MGCRGKLNKITGVKYTWGSISILWLASRIMVHIAWGGRLALFMPRTNLSHIMTAEACEKPLDLDDVRQAMNCQVGREMFDAEAKKLRHQAYIAVVEALHLPL